MNISHALSVRSDFSVGQSLLQVDHIVFNAKRHGYESVALVDDMSIHNLVDFSNRCKKEGIKPIIGCRLRVVDDPTHRVPKKNSGLVDKPNPLVMIKVYAIDERGVASLMKLLSRANSEEYFYYHSRVGWADVFELEGVAVTTGDFQNLFHHPNYEKIIGELRHQFQHFYVELAPIDTPLFDTLNAKALKLVDATPGLKTLVTYPFMYRDDADADTLSVLNAITTNTKMSVAYRPQQFVKDFGFKPPMALAKRMVEAHKRAVKHSALSLPDVWKQGLANIDELAGLCQYEFKKMPVSLPDMADNEFVALGQKCIAGWKRRFAQPVLGHKPDVADLPRYQARLKYELSVLKRMGFSGYFLLVEDLVSWAKSQDILTGPGRGSVGGSLVAYLIGITDVDPLRFNLLFERFINPDRIDLPDADLDFMSTRRHEVVEYLRDKYGADRVAGISNFSTLASASALRDTGRVHDLDNLTLSATKLVPKEHGQSFNLTEAAKVVPELERFRDEHPDVWGHSLKLEGVLRSFGKHAAGVIVGGEPLTNRAVVETRGLSTGEIPIVNWDKRTVEELGLVKMDVLGLSTLDVLGLARDYIKERHHKDINYLDLPLEEDDIMEAFGRGDTTGVFQLESPGMKKLLRDLASVERLSFEEVAAATALYRPGPMDSGLMDDYVQIRKGMKSPHYAHPVLERVLGETQGVVVYQEQTMNMVRELAGFSGPDADHLRKAIGKKDLKQMAAMKEEFVTGAAAGFVEVETDDGRTAIVHRKAKFAVKGSPERMTIEEVYQGGFELIEGLPFSITTAITQK